MSNPVCQFSLSQSGATVQMSSNNVVPSPWYANSETVDWGDGSATETLSFQGGGTNPSGGGATHTYNANGTFTVTATLGANQGAGVVSAPDSYFTGYGTAEVTSYSSGTGGGSSSGGGGGSSGVGPGGSGPPHQGTSTTGTSTNGSTASPPASGISATEELYIVLGVAIAAVVIAVLVLRRKK
jgi:hypothetical protein